MELISESLELATCKPVNTPGVKNHSPELESAKDDDDGGTSLEANDGSEESSPSQVNNLHDLLIALTSDNPCAMMGMEGTSTLSTRQSRLRRRGLGLQVSFGDEDSFHEVPAYSTIYGVLPFTLFATATGWKRVGPRANPYTGKSTEVMNSRLMARARRSDKEEIDHYRQVMIRTCNARLDGDSTLLEPGHVKSFTSEHFREPETGTVFEPDIMEVPTFEAGEKISAVKSQASKFKKRLGAKQVKNFEREASLADGALNSSAATTFRAVSARSNYLAQDRPDGTYSSKELCREFSRPNTHSLQKLKRLGRYYVGRPRLVYRFEFGDKLDNVLDVYCDTDFAGCSQTRQSTSGGCAMINGRLIKHWSKTQPTIALSSGEAELVGIGQGFAQALGLQSLAKDMNWIMKVQVHSDATAAIGIAKRRGLGKVRHLHTADLWVQERVRNGDVTLLKVLGSDNPADIFTKYVDAATMNKALDFMNVHFMSGRPECAPAAMGIPGASTTQE